MEALECFFIFLYGITNVFLEHLSAWGDAWVSQDFEHVAISLLFIGGGLVGGFQLYTLQITDYRSAG
jgi:hypothetical protein